MAARKLRNWRRDQGYSQTEVATLLGTSQKMISRYESGLSEPPIERALKLSHISKGVVPIKDW